MLSHRARPDRYLVVLLAGLLLAASPAFSAKKAKPAVAPSSAAAGAELPVWARLHASSGDRLTAARPPRTGSMSWESPRAGRTRGRCRPCGHVSARTAP